MCTTSGRDTRAFCVRYERLEDQLNDLTELHQHETSNLKQELASIEEKVAYQAYERARDIQVITHTSTPKLESVVGSAVAPAVKGQTTVM